MANPKSRRRKRRNKGRASRLELIRDRLKNGIDRDRMWELFLHANYALGKEPGNGWASGISSWTGYDSNERFPLLPDFRLGYHEVGVSRPILMDSYRAMSRLCSNVPIPVFKDIEIRQVAEARSEFFRRRYVEGDWHDQILQTFSEGDMLGVGALEVGVDDTPEGWQRVTVENIRARNVVYDRTCRDPRKSRWVAFIKQLSIDEAMDRFGATLTNKHRKVVKDPYEGVDPLEVVVIIEYYDVDPGLYACFIGSTDDEPYELRDSDYPILPVVWFTNWTPPGLSYPLGRVVIEGPFADLRNDIERSMRDQLHSPGMDFVDPAAIDPDSLHKLELLSPTRKVIKTLPDYEGMQGNGPLHRVNKEPVDPLLPVLLNYTDRQLATDSQQTDLDRGEMPKASTPATTVANLQAASVKNGAHLKTATKLFLVSLIRTVNTIAALYDTEPIILDVDGRNIPYNNPGDWRSSLDQLFNEPSSISLSDETFSADDDALRRVQRTAALKELMPFVQAGIVDPVHFAKQFLISIGERDTDQWLRQGATEQQPQPQDALAGQGTPPGLPGTAPNG